MHNVFVFWWLCPCFRRPEARVWSLDLFRDLNPSLPTVTHIKTHMNDDLLPTKGKISRYLFKNTFHLEPSDWDTPPIRESPDRVPSFAHSASQTNVEDYVSSDLGLRCNCILAFYQDHQLSVIVHSCSAVLDVIGVA